VSILSLLIGSVSPEKRFPGGAQGTGFFAMQYFFGGILNANCGADSSPAPQSVCGVYYFLLVFFCAGFFSAGFDAGFCAGFFFSGAIFQSPDG
jgi:hypothetical protein